MILNGKLASLPAHIDRSTIEVAILAMSRWITRDESCLNTSYTAIISAFWHHDSKRLKDSATASSAAFQRMIV
jgi:hypothetical protein